MLKRIFLLIYDFIVTILLLISAFIVFYISSMGLLGYRLGNNEPYVHDFSGMNFIIAIFMLLIYISLLFYVEKALYHIVSKYKLNVFHYIIVILSPFILLITGYFNNKSYYDLEYKNILNIFLYDAPLYVIFVIFSIIICLIPHSSIYKLLSKLGLRNKLNNLFFLQYVLYIIMIILFIIFTIFIGVMCFEPK